MINIQQTAMSRPAVNNRSLTMTSLEIAELTGKRHAHVMRDIRAMLQELGEDQSKFGSIFLDSYGREQSQYELNKELTLTLLLGYDVKARLKVVRRWQELENELAHAPITPLHHSKVADELAVAESFARMLRPAPSSQVLMLQTIAANNGLNASFLPSYAIDAPSDSTTGSSEPTASLTSLLKENGIRKQAKDYNLLLQKVGFLERCERKSKSGSIKQFWSITELGERYGKNITSAQNSRETQPHWYVSRFDELHSVLTSKGEL